MVARRQGSLDKYLTLTSGRSGCGPLYFQYLAKPPESSKAIHRQQLRELEERAAEIESGPVT